MNYEPIVAGTQSNGFAGIKASDNASQAKKETEPIKDYIFLPLWTGDPPFSHDSKSSHDDGSKPSSNDGKKVDEDPSKECECNDQKKEDNVNNTNNVNTVSLTVNAVGINEDNELPFDKNMLAFKDVSTFNFSRDDEDDGAMVDEDPSKECECNDQKKEDNVNNTNNVNTVSLTVNAVGINEDNELPFDKNMLAFKDVSTFNFSRDDEDDGAMVDMKNLDTTIQVSPTPAIRIHNDHPLDQIKEEVYLCKPLGFEDPYFPDRVYKVEKALYRLHQAPRAWYETLSTYLLKNEFLRGKNDKTLFIKRHKGDILLVQVYVDDIIFGSTRKGLCNAFKRFTEVKTASTPIETQKPLLKDDDDGKNIIITEASIRRGLQLADEEGIDCLPNFTILEQLVLMGIRATVIICLATNQKFNYSKWIIDSMIRNLDNMSGKFLMYLRVGKGFSGRVTPLFPKIVVQSEVGEGSTMPTNPHHTPTILQSSSQPQKAHKPRKPIRKVTQVPQPSDLIKHVADEAVHKKLRDSLVRATTIAFSLGAEHACGNIAKTQSKVSLNESISQRTASGGGPRCQEAMRDTTAQT
nr:putative ribonuclease H-like domain-containing protein [Tanacetum cinerariifolium]